jgi:hypothetical protein
VVSDHGFTRTHRELDLNEALRQADLLQVDDQGRVRGWRAFAWGLGGAAAIVLREGRDPEARLRIRALLAELLANSGPVERWVEMDPADRPGGSPRAAFKVSLRADTRLVDTRSGWIERAAEPGGDHGHDPQRPEMDAVFVIAGPGVPRGLDLGRIDMRDVAPTLASLLRVSLPDAEGRDLLTAPKLRAGHPRTLVVRW